MDIIYQFLIFFSIFVFGYSLFLYAILKNKSNSTLSKRLENKNRLIGVSSSFIGLFILISMLIVAYVNNINDIIWNYLLFTAASTLIIFGVGIYIGAAIKEEKSNDSQE